jgi:hypothetical protein
MVKVGEIDWVIPVDPGLLHYSFLLCRFAVSFSLTRYCSDFCAFRVCLLICLALFISTIYGMSSVLSIDIY